MGIRTSSRLLLLFAWQLMTAAFVAGQTNQQAPEPQAGSAALTQARTLLAAGAVDSAIEALKAIPKAAADESQVGHLLGLAYYQKADYPRAIEYLSSSVKRYKEGSAQYRQSVQLLGMSHYFLGHSKEAIPYLELVKGWAPGNVENSYVLGITYLQAHDAERARGNFARMFSVGPDSASAYLINAQMMIRQRFEELAEKELARALEIDPKLPQANFLLGELAIYRANIDLGIELLKKEIAINPGFAMSYYMLGEGYSRQLKWDEAIAPLQKSIWLNPFFSGPYIVLGKVYLKKGDLPNSESILRRALAMDPNNYSGHHLLAQVLQQADRMAEAKKEFEIAESLRTASDK
ncbi:MAG TPA: tetratricopeptide repeat protein [Blastocatellia bacterium]|jgi:tetratricopeptide (TPR) repeat protein|nr:tetratricopeptide repeat protein [Blastocatellia bacterium]